MNTFLPLALASLGALATLGSTKPEEPEQAAKPTIVLVHGAFADGSCWSKVVPILQKDGYYVTAVKNPLSSYAEDVANTKRVIDAQKGPVVVVGHSYGGAVITGAAAGNANVKSLVYIAAFGPEEGETLGAMLEKYPTDLGKSLVPDAAGFVTIARDKFHDVFTADLPIAESASLAAMQGPISGAIFGTPMPAPAWKTIPSWYLVAQEDGAINPDLERFYAKRMGAKTTELKSSHVAFLSHPQAVAKMIEEAAK